MFEVDRLGRLSCDTIFVDMANRVVLLMLRPRLCVGRSTEDSYAERGAPSHDAKQWISNKDKGNDQWSISSYKQDRRSKSILL